MKDPFTPEEINKAIKSLKDGKSVGTDETNEELLKNAPAEINEEIAKILNITAETGRHPKEIKYRYQSQERSQVH